MSVYLTVYVQIKNDEGKWEAVGPFNKNGELQAAWCSCGLIRDLFSSYGTLYWEDRFDANRRINFDELAPEIRDLMFDEEGDHSEEYSYTSLAALNLYLLNHNVVPDYDKEWKDGQKILMKNPAWDLYNRIIGLVEMMGYYLFDELSKEDVRLIYCLG